MRGQEMIHKDLPFSDCEIKLQSGRGKATTFEGYASVWGRVDAYGDTILKGAFSKTIMDEDCEDEMGCGRKPMMLFQHNPSNVIGKWLHMEEDDKGLMVRGELTPGHSMAADVGASLKHGAMSGLSIGGYTKDWEPTEKDGRLIKEFSLFEVSVVAMPAEHEARIDTATVKSMLDSCETIRDIERLLRDEAGLSNSLATALVAKMRKIAQGELEEKARKETSSTTASEMLRVLEDLKRTYKQVRIS